MTQEEVVVRGKKIGARELNVIHRIIESYRLQGRTFISRQVCEELFWRQPNGQLQDVASREILRRLEALGLIRLPPAQNNGHNERKRYGPPAGEPLLFGEESPQKIEGALKDWQPTTLRLVTGEGDARQWRELVARHHYLSYVPMVGRSLKYFIYLQDQIVGAISWGSPCWKLAPRDCFIGWDQPARQRNLQGVAGNHRFLLFPWIKVKNLASHVLGLAVNAARQDWLRVYGMPLYLLESFVDPSRFKGTCYKASNWQCLGQSKGSSKSGNSYRFHGQVKDIYVYPLVDDFRERLRN